MILCDLSRPITLEAVRGWREEVDKFSSDIPTILVCNKGDLLINNNNLKEEEEMKEINSHHPNNKNNNQKRNISQSSSSSHNLQYKEGQNRDENTNQHTSTTISSSSFDEIKKEKLTHLSSSISSLINETNIPTYFVTSAKNGQNVTTAFRTLSEMIEDGKEEYFLQDEPENDDQNQNQVITLTTASSHQQTHNNQEMVGCC